MTAAAKAFSDFDKIQNSNIQDCVAACYAHGVMSGVGDGTFSGSANMTRAQACIVLLNLEKAISK